MDHQAFTAHYTDTCSRRFRDFYLHAMNRQKVYHRLIAYLLEVAEAHQLEIYKVELIEREQWDYVLHLNETIAIHCPVIAWQKED